MMLIIIDIGSEKMKMSKIYAQAAKKGTHTQEDEHVEKTVEEDREIKKQLKKMKMSKNSCRI